MFWAGIVDDQLVGPFRVREGVKMNSESYISCVTDHFVKWYHSIDPTAHYQLARLQKKQKLCASQCLFLEKKAHGLASIIA